MVKKIILMLLVGLFSLGHAAAQNTSHNSADNIVGVWMGTQNGDKYKMKIVRLTDGSYRGQIIWMENDKDSKGNKRLDTKNPDKKLRNTPCDRIVIFSGLKYNAKKNLWDGTKIYDPQRGMRANLTITIEKDGKLKMRGSIMGIGESVYLTRVSEK